MQVTAGQVGSIGVVLLDIYGNALLTPPLELAGSYLMGPELVTTAANSLW